MKNNKTEDYFEIIDNKVKGEVYAETLVNLMRAMYEVGFSEGSKSTNTKKELDIIYEVISDILDSEVQLITNKEDREIIEEELTNYLMTLVNISLEEEEDNIEKTYLKSISRDYNIITRYIKLISMISNTKEESIIDSSRYNNNFTNWY